MTELVVDQHVHPVADVDQLLRVVDNRNSDLGAHVVPALAEFVQEAGLVCTLEQAGTDLAMNAEGRVHGLFGKQVDGFAGHPYSLRICGALSKSGPKV